MSVMPTLKSPHVIIIYIYTWKQRIRGKKPWNKKGKKSSTNSKKVCVNLLRKKEKSRVGIASIKTSNL